MQPKSCRSLHCSLPYSFFLLPLPLRVVCCVCRSPLSKCQLVVVQVLVALVVVLSPWQSGDAGKGAQDTLPSSCLSIHLTSSRLVLSKPEGGREVDVAFGGKPLPCG
jgi:hypothetical protein